MGGPPKLYRSLQATGSGVQENGDLGCPNPEHMGVPKTIAALVVINIPIEELWATTVPLQLVWVYGCAFGPFLAA